MKTAQRSARRRRTLLRTRPASQKSQRKAARVTAATTPIKARRAARGARAVAALVPATQDEFPRIAAGELSSFSSAATTLMARCGEMAQQIARFVSDETMIAAETRTRVARSRDLAAALTIQRQFAVGWHFRAFFQNIAVAGQMMQAFEAVLAPARSIVTRNSRRFS